MEGTFGSSDLQRSKSCPLTFALAAASCLALIKLCKHPNHEAASAHINPTSFLPLYFVDCVILHIIPLKPYHRTVFFFFFAPNDSKSKSLTDKHRRTGVRCDCRRVINTSGLPYRLRRASKQFTTS